MMDKGGAAGRTGYQSWAAGVGVAKLIQLLWKLVQPLDVEQTGTHTDEASVLLSCLNIWGPRGAHKAEPTVLSAAQEGKFASSRVKRPVVWDHTEMEHDTEDALQFRFWCDLEL